MHDSRKQEVEIHLAEYNTLRAELDHYTQRIDRMAGVYLTVLFGIVGYLLRPEGSFDINSYVELIEESATLTALYLLLVILNSILLIIIWGYFLGVLSMAQYLTYCVSPRISEIVGSPVIQWDKSPQLSVKVIWIPIRSLGHALFSMMAMSASLIVLLFCFHALSKNWLLITVYIMAWIFFFMSLAVLVSVGIAGRRFHSIPPKSSSSGT